MKQMAEAPQVARFRRELSSDIRSGKNSINVAGSVKMLKTESDVLACLDIWCTLFKPSDWTETRRQKQRAQFAHVLDAGQLLFLKAIALANHDNGLAQIVGHMPILQALPMTRADEAKRQNRYANRYAMLNQDGHDRKTDITRKLNEYNEGRRKTVLATKNLTGFLNHLYFERNGVASKVMDDLIELTFDEPAKRRRFEQLAEACEEAWVAKKDHSLRNASASEMIASATKGEPVPVSDYYPVAAKIEKIQYTFKAFSQWVAQDMRTPIDFFRLASWAREPSDALWNKLAYRRSPQAKRPSSKWSNVWEELYLEIAARAINNSLSKWKIEAMYNARLFVGHDRLFLDYPLMEGYSKLFWNRLKLADQRQTFDESNLGRRRAHKIAQHNNLILLDEVQTVERLNHIQKQVQENLKWVPKIFVKTVKNRFAKDKLKEAVTPSIEVVEDKLNERRLKEWVAKHSIQGKVNQRYERWELFKKVDDAFTVLWVERVPSGGDYALVELPAVPGFVFKSVDPFGGLANIHQEAFYRDLARRAEILTKGALELLKGLGYVFDFATAAFGGGGIRMIVFRFVGELFVDETVELGLDSLHVENPWLREVIKLGVNFVPKPSLDVPTVKDIPEIDLDLARKARALELEAPGLKSIPSLDLKQDIGEVIADSVLDEKSVRKLYRELDPGENLRDRIGDAADDVGAWLGERVPDVISLSPRQFAFDGPGISNKTFLNRIVDDKSLAPNTRGTASPGRSSQKSVDRLRNSELFKTLKRYDGFLGDEVAREQRRARARVLERLADPKDKMDRQQAIKELTTMLNRAREAVGEYVAAVAVFSNLRHFGIVVADFLVIPTRANGVPVFDFVLKSKDRPPKYIFVEVKGGERTSLGTTKAQNLRRENNATVSETVPNEKVRQASGEWYYQRLLELSTLGGKKNEALAKELMQAIREEKATFLIIKSGIKRDPIVLRDPRPTEWFTNTRFDEPQQGLPIPLEDYHNRPLDRRLTKKDY